MSANGEEHHRKYGCSTFMWDFIVYFVNPSLSILWLDLRGGRTLCSLPSVSLCQPMRYLWEFSIRLRGWGHSGNLMIISTSRCVDNSAEGWNSNAGFQTDLGGLILNVLFRLSKTYSRTNKIRYWCLRVSHRIFHSLNFLILQETQGWSDFFFFMSLILQT